MVNYCIFPDDVAVECELDHTTLRGPAATRSNGRIPRSGHHHQGP